MIEDRLKTLERGVRVRVVSLKRCKARIEAGAKFVPSDEVEAILWTARLVTYIYAVGAFLGGFTAASIAFCFFG